MCYEFVKLAAAAFAAPNMSVQSISADGAGFVANTGKYRSCWLHIPTRCRASIIKCVGPDAWNVMSAG